MQREPHENVATVLVDPAVLRDLEVHLMSLDLRLWPIATAEIVEDGPRRAFQVRPSSTISAVAIVEDGPRRAFQVRRRMLMAKRGAWDDAAHWVPVWIGFGESWHDGDEPLPWEAHQVLWRTLERYAEHTRYRLGLGGIPRLAVPRDRIA